MTRCKYTKQLDYLLNKFSEENRRPKLLLHACCGPCSSSVLEFLCTHFDITVLFYNPNIYPDTEYYRRLNELKDLYKIFPPVVEHNIPLIVEEYNPEEYYTAINVKNEPELADEKERGERCRRCYRLRLEKAFEYAQKGGFDYFCTTLSISRFKSSEKINQEGYAVAEAHKAPGSPEWLPSNFRTKNGAQRSLDLSAEYGLYRQQYCGCVYSSHRPYHISEKKKEKPET